MPRGESPLGGFGGIVLLFKPASNVNFAHHRLP
jgi:hypothetical protein